MRVAILSDIHGNLLALEATLADLRRRKIEKILCLGDVAATGPQPCEAIELLQALELSCVMGNADEALTRDVKNTRPTAEWGRLPEEDRYRWQELDEWTRRQLSKFHRRYLSTFKPTITFTPTDRPSFLCYHGSPKSNLDKIEATTSDDELAKYLQGYEADIFTGGHTHMQFFRPFRDSIVMNPGSVGLPFQVDPSGRVRNPTRAEYAVVSLTGKSFGLEFLSVPYSRAKLETAVRDSGLPNADWWLSDWISS